MKATVMTRHDLGIGDGPFDSIKWAFEVHLKQPDNPRFHSAILYGNEDCPQRIEFFSLPQPTIKSRVLLTWNNPQWEGGPSGGATCGDAARGARGHRSGNQSTKGD